MTRSRKCSLNRKREAGGGRGAEDCKPDGSRTVGTIRIEGQRKKTPLSVKVYGAWTRKKAQAESGQVNGMMCTSRRHLAG